MSERMKGPFKCVGPNAPSGATQTYIRPPSHPYPIVYEYSAGNRLGEYHPNKGFK